jgi:hypothetical protein
MEQWPHRCIALAMIYRHSCGGPAARARHDTRSNSVSLSRSGSSGPSLCAGQIGRPCGAHYLVTQALGSSDAACHAAGQECGRGALPCHARRGRYQHPQELARDSYNNYTQWRSYIVVCGCGCTPLNEKLLLRLNFHHSCSINF